MCHLSALQTVILKAGVQGHVGTRCEEFGIKMVTGLDLVVVTRDIAERLDSSTTG
jgi:hypothetical protein